MSVRGPPPPLPKATAEGGKDIRQKDRKLGVGMRSSRGCLGRGEAFPFFTSSPNPTICRRKGISCCWRLGGVGSH